MVIKLQNNIDAQKSLKKIEDCVVVSNNVQNSWIVPCWKFIRSVYFVKIQIGNSDHFYKGYVRRGYWGTRDSKLKIGPQKIAYYMKQMSPSCVLETFCHIFYFFYPVNLESIDSLRESLLVSDYYDLRAISMRLHFTYKFF